MHIVLVAIHIQPDWVEAFKAATLENAQSSIHEPGIVRFDVLQQADDPARFILHEVYQSAEDQLRHRETAHYQRWKDAVATMMAEPRQGVRYLNLYPADDAFAKPK